MAEPIDFYFDFSSPYGYFASLKIEALGERFGRTVTWRPIMIGTAFKASGNQPLVNQPLKGEYSRHDWDRMGRYMQVPWRFPSRFPVGALAPSRAFWWLNQGDPALAVRFAGAVFLAYFGEDRDISDATVTADIGEGLGIARAALLEAVQMPEWKQRLKAETDGAIARGVFGSPFIVVDGEAFWGADRLWMVKKWLERGGW
ncbi:MAG: 2-hydroxychromene-2-carboxylate isomerase [Magnetospirillum sp.]|nr:MAG: 2-hydroxychromene-2-carboxylate isomerase [Magnetospirillum sp.]